MQGNKKQADGQSDSSSIGSLVDDTDREVCNLTARAFKSLCVAELEPSYTELDPALSSNAPHPFPSKLFHGPQDYVIRENAGSPKRRSTTEEHPTFQQFPKDTQGDKIASTNNTPNIRRNLGLPMPGLRSHKHTSKVSSLIKTFDKGEKQPSLEIPKQPVQNHLTGYPLFLGDNMALWGSKAILNIQNELCGFSDTCQDMANASSKHGIHRRQSKMDLVCPHSFYFSEADNSKYHLSPVSRKTVKHRSGKAKEPIRRGRFLHSENSAFESWNAHHKKLTEVDDAAEIIPKGRHLTYVEEAPFLQQSRVPEHKLYPPNFTPPKAVEEDIFNFAQKYEASLSPSALTHPLVTILSKTKDTDLQISLPQASDLPACACKMPISPPLTSSLPFPPALNPPTTTSPASVSNSPMSPPPPQNSVPSVAATHVLNARTLVPEMTVLPEKANSSADNNGLENICPPWRKQKAALVGMGGSGKGFVNEVLNERDSLHRKPSDPMSLSESTTADPQVAWSDPSSPNFSISELLTPAIPPKEEKEPPEDPLLLINSPLSEPGTARESEERAACYSQNNYKSKAPSLLFNLKDIRKRVKSTYSPSPLLRALEDKKKIKELDNMKANVTAVNMLEEGSETLLDYDERSHQPSEQMDRVQEKDNTANLNGNYLTWNAPKSKADAQHYQNRPSLWRGGSVGVSESEVVSATELYPDDDNGSHYPLSPNSYFTDVTSDQQMYTHSLHLQGPKHDKTDLSQNAVVEPQVSPNRFFTAEENMINNENQVCLLTENEQKGSRSTSSSEHSFVSIIDQPYQNEAPYSLMQLFQKACLQESQRKKNSMSEEEKLSSEERDKTEKKKELDSNREMENEKKEEQNEIDSGVQRRVVKDKKEEGWENMDSASEDKSEEPLSPTSSNSFKPNLFMIKDNTIKSPTVIKAVKLPLLRSISCEDFPAVNQHETENQQMLSPIRTTPNNQEMDLSVSRRSSKPHVSSGGTESEAGASSFIPVGGVDCQVAKKGNQRAEYAGPEGQGSFYANELVRGDGRTSVTSTSSQKDLENDEKLTKAREKARARKQNMSSTNQPNPGLEGDLVQRKQTSPTKEETSSLKNDVFSKRRGGSCAKKIISQETGSVVAPENQTSPPASSDAFGDMAASGYLASSTLPSPWSDNMGPSAFTSPLSDASATSHVSRAEKITNSPLLHKATENRHAPSAMETANLVETRQYYGDASNSPVFNGRQSLMGRMAKTAAKPPAVPPKTEKALRRAKKLANRRGKMEAQQKKSQDESTSQCTDTAHSQLAQSPLSTPVCPNSPLIPSKSNLRLKSMPSLRPTPSLPDTQRKLLQDPDSGEYFIVDLPIQLKTFYDPETGRYVQVSIPPSSSETPPSAFVLHPCPAPLPVSPVPAMASPPQLSESASLMQGTLSASDWQPGDQYPEPPGTQPCVGSAVSDGHSQEPDRLQRSSEKDVGLSAKAGIISTGAIGDFVVEGVL